MTKGDMMQAPFPWFGGKRKVASEVWAAMGDVDNYVEPFAGSLAVLLERPAWHAGKVETVNDADQYLANFWRALSCDPDAVAYHADWPVNEADLFARHMWLVNEGRRQLAAGMDADPDWFDAKSPAGGCGVSASGSAAAGAAAPARGPCRMASSCTWGMRGGATVCRSIKRCTAICTN